MEVQGSASSKAAPPSGATSGPRARSRTPPVQVCRRPKKNAMVAADFLDQKCVTCKLPRHRCFQAGDWACALCGQHNYTGTVHCNNYKCNNFDRHAAPLPSRRQVQDSGEVWCISCQMWRSHCWKITIGSARRASTTTSRGSSLACAAVYDRASLHSDDRRAWAQPMPCLAGSAERNY